MSSLNDARRFLYESEAGVIAEFNRQPMRIQRGN